MKDGPTARLLRRSLFAATACSWAALLCACKSQTTEKNVAEAEKAQARAPEAEYLKPGPDTLAALLAQEDTDGDQRITVLDRGKRSFTVPGPDGTQHTILGTYHLANLVQELFLADLDGERFIPLRHVREPIATRLSRLITERYWDNLTRRIDDEHLDQVLVDTKTDARRRVDKDPWPSNCTPAPEDLPQFLYVPHSDPEAFRYYSAMVDAHPSLVVCRLPKEIDAEWVRNLSATAEHGSRHGLLSLGIKASDNGLRPLPYGVPGGRFNEMYGWDSYFHLLGLLQDERFALARALVDNQLYEVRHYGRVLNANRTYYLSRSQPPFLSSSVRAVWDTLPRDPEWLKDAISLLTREYEQVWNGEARITPLCRPVANNQEGAGSSVCLSTYHAEGIGEPPEVEPGHFDWFYAKQGKSRGVDSATYRDRYRARALPQEELNELDWFFTHDRSMRESGHDTTYRWSTEEGDRCADFATIDLNALLFKIELDLAYLSKEAQKHDWQKWCGRAQARRDLVQEYLYDGELFFDYRLARDEKRAFTGAGKRSRTVSATTLYPLWASTESPCTTEDGKPLSLFSNPKQMHRLVAEALTKLEAAGGLTATAPGTSMSAERTTARQWETPNGWAPHQILAWEGLHHHGFEGETQRLIYRWLFMIAKNAHDYHGTIPEKYDVVRRSHRVFAEYGNVGTDFSYITPEGFGWMNASIQIGLHRLSKDRRKQLEALVPPERLEAIQRN